MVLIFDGHGREDGSRLRDPALELPAFRSRLYGCFGRRADALFELCDALLTAGSVPSPAHLSLAATHRRGWGSLYAALNKGRMGAEALRNLLARLRLADDPGRARVYAVDRSSWPRCDAECSPGRGYYQQARDALHAGTRRHRTLRERGLAFHGGVGQVGHPLRRLRADLLQSHAACVHALEQADSGAEQHG